MIALYAIQRRRRKMKPINFEEQNCTFTSEDAEVLDLPAFRSDDGQVITKWKMSWRERLHCLLFGYVWLSQLTYGRRLQPQSVLALRDMFQPKQEPCSEFCTFEAQRSLRDGLVHVCEQHGRMFSDQELALLQESHTHEI
jgi:hypothetical protein